MKGWILVLVVGVVLVNGCISEKQTTTTTILNKTLYCETDDDCIVVNADCCGCGALGYRIAIAKGFKENWSKQLGEKCSGTVMCPPMISQHISCFSEALCINNTCTLVPTKDVIASEISKCDNITDSYYKPRCYIALANKRGVSICDVIPEEFEEYNFRNGCRKNVAINAKNYRLCDTIDNSRDKAFCYNEVAKKTDNPPICDLIPEDYGVKYECYVYFSGIEFRDYVNETVMKKIFYCENDSDCVAVQSDCCSCYSGGKNIAVAKSFEETWEQALREKCRDAVCPAVMSDHLTCLAYPICFTNTCMLTPTTTTTL